MYGKKTTDLTFLFAGILKSLQIKSVFYTVVHSVTIIFIQLIQKKLWQFWEFVQLMHLNRACSQTDVAVVVSRGEKRSLTYAFSPFLPGVETSTKRICSTQEVQPQVTDAAALVLHRWLCRKINCTNCIMNVGFFFCMLCKKK